MRIGTQLLAMLATALVGLAAVAGLYLHELRGELLADRQIKTRNLVEVAHSILAHHHDLEAQGMLGRQEAQDRALAAIARMRYDADEYFWVNDMQPRMVMHPFRPDLNGRDLSAFEDKAGKLLFVAFVETVQAGGAGFVPYMWPKPGADEPVEKLSYVAGFAPWGWVIGSGIYIDDVDAIFWQRAMTLLMLIGVVVVGTGGVTIVIGRGITRPLNAMAAVMGELARGRNAAIPALERRDEIGDIARTLRVIHQAGIDAQRIKVALDTATAAVIVTDLQGTVIYQNTAMLQCLTEGLAEIRTDLPGFEPAALPGQPLGRLQKPGERWPSDVGERTRWRTDLGGRTFEIVANPVYGSEDERLGTVLEWTDLTTELAVQSEVDSMVRGAVTGDLSRRVDTAGMTGFMRHLGDSMNQLLEVTSAAVDDMVQMLEALACGDLTRRIERNHSGVFGRLRDHANTTADKLAETANRIASAAEQVNVASVEIAEGSSNLSGRTEQQAASLEETASAMEELAATVRRNAENAQQANQLAGRARDVAGQGGGVVGQAVAAMGRIDDSSQKIADIIGVIDEIAFQTNLLALNAAVEAARAGEAGKGFAVVAAEVRSLAQRSSQASKEIKALIQASTGEVKVGVGLVNETGKALDEIVTSVKRVADIVSEIAAASSEQAIGLEEVNAAVAQMDDMTQKNATLVEESTAAARSLQDQAADLLATVTFFRLRAASAEKPAEPPRAKAPPVAAATVPVSAPIRPKPAKVAKPAAPATAAADDWEEF